MKILKEIKKEILSINPTQKDLRNLGILMGVVLFGLAYFITGLRLWLGIGGFIFLVAGLAVPKILRRFYIIWMSIAIILRYFVFRAFLALFYIIFIIPIGLVMKLSRGNSLDNEKDTYWIKHTDTNG